MSKKDSLIKEIDEISERVRFWHNAILATMNRLEELKEIRHRYIKELEKED